MYREHRCKRGHEFAAERRDRALLDDGCTTADVTADDATGSRAHIAAAT